MILPTRQSIEISKDLSSNSAHVNSPDYTTRMSRMYAVHAYMYIDNAHKFLDMLIDESVPYRA